MFKRLSIPVIFGFVILYSCGPTEERDIAKSSVQAISVHQKEDKVQMAPSQPGNRTAEEMVAAGFRRYGTEKGMVIFRIDGAVKGTEHIYFDHWGWREGKYVNTLTDAGAYKDTTVTVQYLDGERRYEYDPATQTALFFESKQVQASADRYGTKDMVKVGDEMIKKMGGVRTGTGDVRGVTCDVWEIERYRTTLHMWNGLTLKERSTIEALPVARTCILLDTINAFAVEKMLLPEGAVTNQIENR